MRMPQKTRFSLLLAVPLAVAVLAAAALSGAVVRAQSPAPPQTSSPAPVQPAAREGEPAPPVPQDAQVALKVAPDRYVGTIAPGKSKDGVIDLFNTGRVPLDVRAEFQNVRMTGRDGAVEFYVGENPFKLHSFVEFPEESFTIAPGDARRVSFRISVPEGVYPGGYFGSMLFQATPAAEDDEGTSVAQAGQVGTLFVITVPGDADMRGQLTGFALAGNGFDDTKAFEAVYRNTGNTEERPLGVAYEPAGTLRIKNVFGLVVAERKVKGPLTFPGAERRLKASVEKPLWFGQYTAELRLAPPGKGKAGEASVKSVSFWAISPLGASLAAAFMLFLLGLVFWVRRRRHIRRQIRRHSDSENSGRPPSAA